MSTEETFFLVLVFQALLNHLGFVVAGPTVIPHLSFNPYEDAQTIWKAVDGWGTSEDKISYILCRRTYEQRMKVARSFETEHGVDLKKLYRRLLESPAAILSHDLSDTIEGRRRDYGAVTEILCATDNVDKYNIAVFYATTIKEAMKDDEAEAYIALSNSMQRPYDHI
ncbi:hypothetical protein U1Q18_050586, partial [Sarracenia purpurea var. burkii]